MLANDIARTATNVRALIHGSGQVRPEIIALSTEFSTFMLYAISSTEVRAFRSTERWMNTEDECCYRKNWTRYQCGTTASQMTRCITRMNSERKESGELTEPIEVNFIFHNWRTRSAPEGDCDSGESCAMDVKYSFLTVVTCLAYAANTEAPYFMNVYL